MTNKRGMVLVGKKFFILMLGLMCFASFSYAELREVSPEKLQESISKGVAIIDIRRADEWKNTGVIATSNKLTFFDTAGKYDLNDWMDKFQKIVKDKNQPFILVCRSANRTGIVGNFLNEKMEYKNVYHLKGGIKAWMAQKRETIK
mgnify:CR=1 FL=1